jgi:ABC-type molybdate transport system substrate-binding protein
MTAGGMAAAHLALVPHFERTTGQADVTASKIPPPAEVQRVTIFSAGVAVSAKNHDGARALIEFFASRSGMKVMTKSGLDPISRH